MVEEDKSKRPSSSELCLMIRTQYVQTFLKTSSLSAVTRCLYSFPKLSNNLIKFQKECKNPSPITTGFINAITNIKNNIHNKFNQFKEILAVHYFSKFLCLFFL